MENTDLSFYIHKLSNHTDRISHAIYNRKELNECSLTSLFVLDFLYAHRDQRLCQRDIEDEFFINRATASKMLRLMEEKQLIRRTVSDEDKRSKTIELLEKGLELQRKCGAVRQGIWTHKPKALTILSELFGLIRQLVQLLVRRLIAATSSRKKSCPRWDSFL